MDEQGIRRTRSVSKKGGPFHIWTADDFVSEQQVSAKRRAWHSTACQRCRYRKAKCIVSTAPSQLPTTVPRPPCQLCQRMNVECVWDTTDKRRRKRTQAPSKESTAVQIQGVPGGEEAYHNKDQVVASEKASSQLRIHDQNEAQPDNHPGHQPNMGESTDVSWWDDGSLDLGSICIPQDFVENANSEYSFELPRNWPSDVQDFTLGLDFIDPSLVGRSPDPVLQSFVAQAMGGDNPITKSRILRLRCYRRLGPTAAAPGVRRLFVAVQPYPNLPAGQGRDDSRTESSPGGLSISTPRSTWSAYNNLFDSQAQRPHSLILPIILNVFFDHFGGHFPFLQKRVLNYHVRTGEASSFLLNAISALTARFCPLDGPLAILKDRFKGKWRQGAPFLAKAKDQLASLLSIPASDVVAGLVIMAWVEFGDNNEAGMWMYSGMAIRMAQDLGYHRRLEAVADPAQVFRDFSNTTGDLNLTDDQAALHQHKAQLVLFWTAFSLDVYVSLVTGRPTTLQRNEIDAPIPSAEDMNVTQLEWSSSDPMRNRIFPEVVAFMLHFSESLKILNRMTTMSTASLDGDENLPYSSLREFSQARSNLLGRYKSLPRQLTFGVDTYKRSLTSSQSGLFITLHLFFYTFIILLSRKDPCSTRRGLHNPSDESFQPIGNQDQGDTTTLHGTQLEEQQNLEISRMACQKMAHILTVADVVQKTGYLASPFTNHCFFVAASSILHDEAKPGQVVFRDSFMSSTTENDFDLFNDKLREQSEYFRAIGSVLSTLMQRKNLSAGEDDGGQSTGDEDGDNSLGRVVEDPGIVTRYSIR
ncbi:unnamed protein product [Clonostachys rosea f. rosea IK726]|uniref:Zn(2)-C6 fungal-type domain-containing protein n=2 Tax=Bionectria ochroleuca TaxID=29856 RepID=A0A0B7KFC3_BIOOC|nr:unnamed protein product [Clonostachys rosea f. rosea IK726]